MDPWRIEADRGLHELARHRPRSALGHLERAVRVCPASRGSDLARILFYLGVTMRRLGLGNPSLRSWLAAQKLEKRGLGRRMLARYANEYGMERQSSPDEDDWQAFYAVHAIRFLEARVLPGFQSPGEEQLVRELIRFHWNELRARHDLTSKSPADKCRLFRSVRIRVPSFVRPGGADPIPVSFSSGRRVDYEDRCVCGSGRPFRSCCGRTKSVEELVIGTK